ncbi:MAG: hypothetical protein U9N14_06205 [Pseudomonadota bacterium]|nr:hypothetical protein [Pseudomonadota bacterium]
MAQRVWKILGWDGQDWYILTYTRDKEAAFDYHVDEGGWDRRNLKAVEVFRYGVFAYDTFDDAFDIVLKEFNAYFRNKRDALSYASSIKHKAFRIEAWKIGKEGLYGVSGEPLIVYEEGQKIAY